MRRRAVRGGTGASPRSCTSNSRSRPRPGRDPNRVKKKVAVVGKGITFDTGLTDQAPDGHAGMKSDLGGAAAALAAFGALCALPESAWSGSTVSEVHLLLCVAENAIGSGAFRPDDVVTHRSGRTSEINNTDAEGRLVLADGVAYASQPARLGGLACDDVIDIATLTGAQMVATGRHFAVVSGDSEAMERACVDAGRASGDLTHAAVRAGILRGGVREQNRGRQKQRQGQKQRAGELRGTVHRGTPVERGAGPRRGEEGRRSEPEGEEGDRRGERRWLHVDIAGPSVAAGSGRGTGFGVALLVELIAGGGAVPKLKRILSVVGGGGGEGGRPVGYSFLSSRARSSLLGELEATSIVRAWLGSRVARVLPPTYPFSSPRGPRPSPRPRPPSPRTKPPRYISSPRPLRRTFRAELTRREPAPVRERVRPGPARVPPRHRRADG